MRSFQKKSLKSLFRAHNVKPAKRLGQNFLIDNQVIAKIIKSSLLKPDDVVLEIGPGAGALTGSIAKIAKKVVAIEKDQAMVNLLKETLKNCKNATIIKGDILKIDITPLFPTGSHYKVIANLPFYIVSPVIRKFLQSQNPPLDINIICQKEVAQRICAKEPKMNFLAIFVQFYAEPKIIFYIKPNSFFPKPKVAAALIKFKLKPKEDINTDPVLLFKIVRAGFLHPRKQLLNNLSEGLKLNKKELALWLQKNNIKPTQRAELLKIEDWTNLVGTF